MDLNSSFIYGELKCIVEVNYDSENDVTYIFENVELFFNKFVREFEIFHVFLRKFNGKIETKIINNTRMNIEQHHKKNKLLYARIRRALLFACSTIPCITRKKKLKKCIRHLSIPSHI